MAPYHILIVIISSVIPENLVLLTKSEQSGPKSAHIRPTSATLSEPVIIFFFWPYMDGIFIYFFSLFFNLNFSCFWGYENVW